MEQNIAPTSAGGKTQAEGDTTQHEKSVRLKIGMFGFFLFIVFIVGLFWMFTTPSLTVGLTLSFVAGLSMIFLPCTLPLAFVIVPLTMGKDPKKGLLMAFSFTLGLTITLSLYGVFIAAVGKTFGLKSDAEVYAVLLGGIAAFIFGLSEVGLINFKLPSYSGKFPDFIQRQKDYVKTFLLGLLLGNAGVGCPNPAFYLLLGYIATTGDLFNGWFLGFVHGLGRSVPLIFLAILGTLGVNALSGVTRHKEGIGKVMGWMLLIVGAYLLTFGIFGHDWFIGSGIHSAWEQFVVNISGERFGETILQHEHKLVDVPNFIQYGNMFFLGLLALTILTAFVLKRPSRRTILSLSITYIIIALTVGYSTGWTFKIGTNVHIQFRGTTTAPPGGGHMEEMNGHGGVLYHEEFQVREGLVVNLNATPVPVTTGTTSRLDLFVNEKPGNIPVTDLEIEHEKLMHLIGVRSDLNEFFHIHPEPALAPGLFSEDYVFKAPGIYKLWSEIKKDGTIHAFGHPEISVEGGGVREDKKVSFGRNITVRSYQVALEIAEPVVKEHLHELNFDIHSLTGTEIAVEKYLGEKMHLVIIKDDLKQFIHAHPEEDGVEEHTQNNLIFQAFAHGVEEKTVSEGEKDEAVNFHVTFPEVGLYKVFAQFRPKGIDLPPDEALAASFWVKVEERAPPALSGWWINLLWSTVAIVVLSLLVKKFLKVPTQKDSMG